MNEIPNRYSHEPKLRVPAIERALERALEHDARLKAIDTTMRTTLAGLEQRVLDDGRDTVLDRDTRVDYREAIAQLERGALPTEGVLPEISPVVGLPGLRATRENIAALRAELQEYRAQIDVDPDAVAPYRLRPDVGTHQQDGRIVQAGQIVQLTARQYRAWSEKFEPVETPAAT